MLQNKYKVVLKGFDIVKSERIRIVKKGNFTKDSDGIISALESGMLDKYGYNSEVPLFVPVFVLPKACHREDAEAFAVVLKKVAHNGKDLLAVYLVDVQFRKLPEVIQEE